MTSSVCRVLAIIAMATLVLTASAQAQVGKGLVDPNTATEQDLAALPNMTPAIAKALIAKRPFANAVELNTFLTGQGLTAAQLAELYKRAFIHINLNTATADEIMLVPGAGKRMAREFAEYRPWKSFAQFDKEIGKYVDNTEVERLKQYTFIPVNLNTATDADILTIPGAGNRMLREFKEYRPWKTEQQFQKEIGKYVDQKEVARLWRYVTIQ